MPSSRGIARAVCPSAPFLVPRRACVVFHHARSHVGSVAAKHDAARPQSQSSFLRKKKAKEGNIRPPPAFDEQSGDLLSLFRAKCTGANLDDVKRLYPTMLERGLLNHNDTLHIARLIHTRYRSLRGKEVVSFLPEVLPFTDQFIEDIRTGAMQGHTGASLHLISFLKETGQFDRGSNLWSWLRRRSDEFVDAGVYGAAIEMLTAEGKAQLPELEALYAEALRRFPGNFAEYHLSPDAIVPDRGQPVMVKGISVSLFQGIMTARLEHRDWRNSYLAFDTALRLFPTQVPDRFFELLIFKRPLSEAYTAFMMACRSGTAVKPERLTHLLRKLGGTQYRAPTKQRLMAVRGMFNAVQAYIGVGGRFGAAHISALVKGFEGVVQDPSSQDSSSGAINQLIGDTARETVLALSRAGIPLNEACAASMVGLAGKARLPKHLGRTIQDITSTGVELNEVVHRSIVLAAGQIKHVELLEWSWRNLVESAEASGRQLDRVDWMALTRASVDADQAAFVKQQVASLSHAVTDDITTMIDNQIARGPTKEKPRDERGARKYSESDIAVVKNLIAQIKAQVGSIVAQTKSGKLHDFYAQPFHMSLIPRPSLGSEAALRTVYDELTTDPNQPATGQPLRPAVKGASGYPMDALRYANWRLVNELLAEAEVYEQARKEQIEKAVKEGADADLLERIVNDKTQPVLSPRRRPGDRVAPPAGGAARDDDPERKDDIDDAAKVEAVRKEIRRLRAMRDQPRIALDP